jgi:hypothetical protein
LYKLAVFYGKQPIVSLNFSGKNILKIIALVPGHLLRELAVEAVLALNARSPVQLVEGDDDAVVAVAIAGVGVRLALISATRQFWKNWPQIIPTLVVLAESD